MSLFSSLYHLLPSGQGCLEDFHTEIVAHVFRSFPDLTLEWLRKFGVTELTETDHITVTTQEAYEALETHLTGSRPDIVVRLQHGSCLELVFIESKVGSTEGEAQLQRYAEHLAKQTDASRRTLVYITRDYEPKDVCVNHVRFLVRRWSDFYEFFQQAAARSDILTQLLQLMKEHNMAQSNRFNSIDLIALTNFSRARKIMDQTLWEKVDEHFEKVTGKYSNKETALFQYKNFDRYVLKGPDRDGPFEILLGYWLDPETVTDSPWVGGAIQVNPKAPQRVEIVSALMEIVGSKSGTWKSFELSDPKKWGSIRRRRSLDTFLGEEDHVYAITQFFDDILNEMAEFKVRYQKLPWTSQPAIAGAES